MDEEQLSQQLISLREVHWPLAPGWLPEAPGFWVLAGTLVYLLLAVVWRRWRQYQAPYRDANIILSSLYADLAMEPSKAELLRFAEDCKSLIKRYARTKFPKARPDTLLEQEWQEFLQAHSSLGPPPAELTDAIYQPDPEVEPENLWRWASSWIKKQRFRWH